LEDSRDISQPKNLTSHECWIFIYPALIQAKLRGI